MRYISLQSKSRFLTVSGPGLFNNVCIYAQSYFNWCVVLRNPILDYSEFTGFNAGIGDDLTYRNAGKIVSRMLVAKSAAN